MPIINIKSQRLKKSGSRALAGFLFCFLFLVIASNGYAQPAGFNPPPNFDWSIFELRRGEPTSPQNDLEEYDRAVEACMGLKNKIPDETDMFFTDEKFAALERCMQKKGYRLRGLDDFSLYDALPSNAEVNAALDQSGSAAFESETKTPSPVDYIPMLMGREQPGDMPRSYKQETTREPARNVQPRVQNQPRPVPQDNNMPRSDSENRPDYKPQNPHSKTPNRLFVPLDK